MKLVRDVTYLYSDKEVKLLYDRPDCDGNVAVFWEGRLYFVSAKDLKPLSKKTK